MLNGSGSQHRRELQGAAHQLEAVEDLKAVFEDFMPPSYPLEVELQNLVAVQECTSRELLPESFRRLDRDYITRRIRELKALLEEG